MPVSIKPFKEAVASKILALGAWTLLITVLIKHSWQILKYVEQLELLLSVIQLEQQEQLRNSNLTREQKNAKCLEFKEFKTLFGEEK